MLAIYFEIVALVIILLVIPASERTFFSFAQSENLFKKQYDSDENQQSYYLTCTKKEQKLWT